MYPKSSPSNVPGTGCALYLYLLSTISIPSRLPHELWYDGMDKLRIDPTHPFQGFFPVGSTLELRYPADGPMQDHMFTGEEKNPILVQDLSKSTKLKLGISSNAKPTDKVYNPNFREYDDLPFLTKMSNELATMSLAKSIDSWLSKHIGIAYSEQNVVDMLMSAIARADSPTMFYILHGNHIAWCSLAYMRSGRMEPDIQKQFYGQTDPEFYVKDIGTIMPSIMYTLTVLGIHPSITLETMGFDLWDIDKVADNLVQYCAKDVKSKVA